MKRIIIQTLLLLSFFGLPEISFADYPIVGYRYIADPGSLVYNGRVYIFCSNDDDNEPAGTNYNMHSIVCISSADLKNWTDHGVVFDVPRDASWSTKSWAPTMAQRNGKFYLYFGNGGSAIGVAVADNILGPYKDAINKQMVNGSTPGVQPFDGWLFDPMTFIDDDGQAYMYFGGNGDNNMRVIKVNSDMVSVSGSATKFTVPNFFEASWMHKHNGKYYFSYSTNGSAGLRIDYMISDKPTTGFTYGGIVSGQPPQNNNNNHQAIFEFKGEWYEAYHNRTVATNAGVDGAFRRNMAIDKIVHQADGKITKMINTVDGLKQLGYLNPFVRVEAETMSNHNGIETQVCSAGGMNLFSLENGDWTMVEGVDFGSGASSISTRVASTKTGGTIEIRLGSSTGTLIGTVQVPNTGGNQTWQTVNTTLTQTSGVKNVYFVFKGSGTNMFNVDYWTCQSNGPTVTIAAPTSTTDISVGQSVVINATATAKTGTITKVEFFVDGKSVGTDNTAPYTFTYPAITKGAHTITVEATDSQGDKGSAVVSITAKVPQGPYNGTWNLIPGTIQAENFDVGGNGFAYSDASAGNTGGATFRTDEDVDLEVCTDAGAGYNIGYATAGEWLEYSVDVQKYGLYDISFRVAANGASRTLSLSMDNKAIAINVAIPNTAGWQAWQTVTVKNVTLQPGKQILRLTIGATDYVNINYLTFALVKEIKQEPYKGTAHQIPGRIEAEEYDLGGEGLAYHEGNTSGNQGLATLRNDEVDIEATGDVDGMYNIAYTLKEEWLEYSVNVASTGKYDMEFRVAKDGTGGLFHVEIDGVNVTGSITVPNTGGWQVWQTVKVPNINLTKGAHIMKIAFDSDYMNFNYVEIKDTITGVDDNQVSMIQLYPNPFTSEGLQIELEGNFEYKISDVNGNMLEKGEVKDNELVGQDLSSGVYFITIEQAMFKKVYKLVKL